MRNPKRMAAAGAPEPVVLYSAQHRPPEFLSRVIHAAGGRLVVGDGPRPEAEDGPSPSLDEVIESSFAEVARAVAAEYGAPLSPNGLALVEGKLAASAGDPEDDEFAYWSAVLKLGSFAGEAVRASNGGRWTVTDSGSLPFALITRFRGEEATVNPLGKALKRFTNGDEDSLVALVSLIQSQP